MSLAIKCVFTCVILILEPYIPSFIFFSKRIDSVVKSTTKKEADLPNLKCDVSRSVRNTV